MTRTKLSQARDEYLASRRSQGIANGTIKNNRLHITALINTVGDIECRKVAPKHIDQTMAKQGRSNEGGALGNYHATYTKFFRWCRSRGYMKPDQDPMAERRTPKFQKRERHLVPVHKFPLLLQVAGDRHPRDRAVIALGLFTMLRQSEIARLRVADLDLDAETLAVYRQKTGTFDTLPVSAELDAEMRRWLTWYSARHGSLIPDWYLVPARQQGSVRRSNRFANDPASPVVPSRRVSNMADIAKAALEAAGEPLTDPSTGQATREGMHTLRRSAARARFDVLREEGYDGSIREVQSWLGHAQMGQTEGYIQITPDKDARNRRVQGQPMFPVDTGNVLPFRHEKDASG